MLPYYCINASVIEVALKESVGGFVLYCRVEVVVQWLTQAQRNHWQTGSSMQSSIHPSSLNHSDETDGGTCA